MHTYDSTDHQAVIALKMLGVETVANADSGHPGIVLGATPMMYVLFRDFLKADAKHPTWANRDRFVLSAGHGSAMLYSMLHATGYDLSIADMKNFRQLGSKTPGHPEHGEVPGVDATTGPLGQGLGMSIGMALAEKHLHAIDPEIDHYTYTVVGDGDLMEGISHEAASFAGANGLNKLIALYDSNDITLDGTLARSSHDNVKERFLAYGWQYLRVDDGEDLSAIAAAIEAAQASTDRPTIIEVKTVIGLGAPDEGTNKVHGSPIKGEKLEALRDFYNWHYEPFEVPTATYERLEETFGKRGHEAYANSARQEFVESEIVDYDFSELAKSYTTDKSIATRIIGQQIIQDAAAQNKLLWGGAADLSSSTKTDINDTIAFTAETPEGRNVNFGVREFAQGAMMNGVVLHGGTRIFGSGFFIFSDYMRPAIRLAALQQLPVTYVFTHDSIAVGEDGPTHEPIEQLASYRAMPGLTVYRPADGKEMITAWNYALTNTTGPTIIVESRQNLPILDGTESADVVRGGYVLSPAQGETPAGVLIATGSEVHLAINAQTKLREQGVDVAVVSMPSTDLFDQQSAEYRESVLPAAVKNRMSLELGATLGWDKYVGLDGLAYGLDRFGLSAPADDAMAELGFTTDAVVSAYLAKFN